jgi:hypothetical protein
VVWKKIEASPTLVAESWLGLTFFKEPPEMLSTSTTICAVPAFSVIEQRPLILSPGACAKVIAGKANKAPTKAESTPTFRPILDPPTLF